MDRVLEDLTPKRGLTDAEVESVQSVLNGALAYKNKEITLTEFMRIGTVEYQDRMMPEPMPSPRYTRWLATGLGDRTDERWQALQRILDWTVRKQHIVTSAGVMNSFELHEHDQAIRIMRGATSQERSAA